MGLLFLLIFYIATGTHQIDACSIEEFSANGVCHKCSPSCPGRQVKISDCNATADIICRCPGGTFWDNGILYCNQCLKCLNGEVERVKCRHESNRLCEVCPKGTFANGTVCSSCTHCEPGQTVKNVCQKNKDTQCLKVDKPTKSTRRPFTTPTFKGVRDSLPTSVDNFQTHSTTDSPTLVIVIVVVCVLVLIAVVIAAFICCGRSSRTLQSKVPDTSNTMYDEESTDFHPPVIQVPTIKDNGFLFRDVNYLIFEELSNLLNPQSFHDWKELAGRLGIPSKEIRSYTMDGGQACQNMLLSWQTQHNSTVFVLYTNLRAMQRDDAASLLLPVLFNN